MAAPAVAGDAATRDRARNEAEDILAERRFQDPDIPSPLREPLTWIGDRIQDVFNFLFGWIGGPAELPWLILGALVMIAAALVALRLARRRADVEGPEGVGAVLRAHLSADDLEREADAEEARGDHARAVRLRFRAGLMRLASQGVIPRAAAITNREVARLARAPSFPSVAQSFDEITYGRRPAGPDDLELSRAGWVAVRRETSAGRGDRA
jgi:hypothetical protein